MTARALWRAVLLVSVVWFVACDLSLTGSRPPSHPACVPRDTTFFYHFANGDSALVRVQVKCP